MTCEVEKQDGIVRVRGEMTIYGAAAFKDLFPPLLVSETGTCVLDLRDVSEIDTTGIQFLLLARRLCAAAGTVLSLANVSEPVREALALLHGAGLGEAA